MACSLVRGASLVYIDFEKLHSGQTTTLFILDRVSERSNGTHPDLDLIAILEWAPLFLGASTANPARRARHDNRAAAESCSLREERDDGWDVEDEVGNGGFLTNLTVHSRPELERRGV